MCLPSRSRNRSRPPSEIKSLTDDRRENRSMGLQDFFSGSHFSLSKGLSREEMISVSDADNSGSMDLDVEEFHRILLQMMAQIDEINETSSNTDDAKMWALQEALNRMDRDGDGIVRAEELKMFSSSVASASSSRESCHLMISCEDLGDMIETAGGPAKYSACKGGFVRLMITTMNDFA